MKKIKILAATAITTIPLTLTMSSCGKTIEYKDYRNISLNDGWKFKLNEETNEQTINLPHDFSITQNFIQPTAESTTTHNTSGTTGFLPGGVGHYKKEFILPKKDNPTVILNFDGSYNDTEVKVNGKVVGNNKYGYNPFAFDISDYVTADGKTKNKLEVTVRHDYITSSRWYPGSGIYRDVNISVVDKLHVAHNGTYVTTPYLRQEKGKNVTVNIDVDVDNNYDEQKSVYVKNRVVDQNGKAVSDWVSSEPQTIYTHQTKKFVTALKVNNPKLWYALHPNLYYVETQVLDGKKVVDQYQTRFGFRYYDFDDNGFWINGRLTKLNGVCLHHDQGALGAAAYNDAMYRQLTIMKDMGINAIRTSHNCPDEDFLRLCDELGFYVMDEAFDTWEFAKTEHDSSDIFKQELGINNNLIDGRPDMTWHAFVMQSMVKRDRNCPSVFMWSLGNELHEGEWHDADVPQERKDEIENEMIGFANELKGIADSLDYNPNTRRWSGIALERNPNPVEGNPDAYIPKCKIGKMLHAQGGPMGFNYGDEQQIIDWIDQHPGNARLYGSETASSRNCRGMYQEILEEDASGKILQDGYHHITSYDGTSGTPASEVLYRTLNFDGYAGQFVWTGFDYIGEPSPWCFNVEDDDPETYIDSWPFPNSSYYGIVDTAGFPKDCYYLYRSHLNDDDITLHLVGSLNSDNMYVYEDGEDEGYTPIDIYTNATNVLIKNGDTPIATVTQESKGTSKGWGYYNTYIASSLKTDVCHIHDSEQKSKYGHSLYSNILVKADEVDNITATAYKDATFKDPIENTVGLKHLQKKNETTTKFNCYSDKKTIKADGKSLAYVTVDLEDANNNLITDYGSQKTVDISWSGAGKVLGVDNGDPSTTEKWQNEAVYFPNKKQAKIRTFGGKAVIIVCAGTKEGQITLKIGSKKVVINVQE